MGWLITILWDVADPHTWNAMRRDLLDVPTIALVASICGCESGVEFADFAEDREDLFREVLPLEHGLPRHDTFSRLFRRRQGAAAIARSGGHRAAGRIALQVVTAFAAEAQLVIGESIGIFVFGP